MLKLRAKNLIRLFFALVLIKRKKDFKIYCNLMEGNVYGGPNRFLKNIVSSNSLSSTISISNWSLMDCHSSLIFSSSWGKSFFWLSRLFNVKSILRVDGFYVPDDIVDERFQQPQSFRNWVNKRMTYDLENFDHVIYQSKFSKKICDKYLFFREENFSIISNGTNTKHFTPKEKEKDDVIRLVILGKHYPKHLRTALEVLKLLSKNHHVELHIIGPMRNGEDLVSEFYNAEEISDELRKIIFCHGIVSFEKLPGLLQQFDILLHVKVGDWCPNAVIESMSCGLPVVCPSWGGSSELVGEAGVSIEGPEWGVDQAFIKGMVDGVITLYKNIDDYKDRARSRVIKNFDIEEVSSRYLKVISPNL